MMNIRKLLTVGGDERMLYTSQSLAEKGSMLKYSRLRRPQALNICARRVTKV